VSATADKFVNMGRISGVYGLKGWIKVFSYTEPRENIVDYEYWRLSSGKGGRGPMELDYLVEAGRTHGRQVLAKLAGVEDRESAAELVGAEISVRRSDLPVCDAGSYYWVDLIGLEVRNTKGQLLGTVDHMLETGEHDVLVLDPAGKRMIPFVMGRTVRDVDIAGGSITVAWDLSYWEQ
jgi:16S rRNA processing protein RimM